MIVICIIFIKSIFEKVLNCSSWYYGVFLTMLYSLWMTEKKYTKSQSLLLTVRVGLDAR